MTIRPGVAWGRPVTRPEELIVAADDAALVRALAESDARGGPSVAVGGGDLGRTLGGPRLDDRDTLNELPLDLLQLRLDGAADTQLAVAHVTARPPWRRGGWLRGAAVVVMNVEFIGALDVAPRGHPNDGRAEVFEVGTTGMGARARVAARRRARTGAHVPHPAIETRSVRRATWSFPHPLVIAADGRRIGRARTLEIVVVADAAVVYA